jgi:transcriptional regulator with XRE-family HTH domain
MQKPTTRRRAQKDASQSAKPWKQVGDRLRELRARASQSRTEAASATGVNALTLIRYEDGSREPSIAAVIAFARTYRVTTDWILTGSRKAV